MKTEIELAKIRLALEHIAKYGKHCDAAFIAKDALRSLDKLTKKGKA